MKTFLWTTLFRFVVFIGVSIALGYGNLVPQGLILDDYYYLEKLLPTQMQSDLEFRGWDRCMQEQEQQQQVTDPAITVETDGITDITTLPAARPQDFSQPDFSELRTDIAGLSQQINDQFNQLSQHINTLNVSCSTEETPVEMPIETPVDPNAQKKSDLQAQIEFLQSELQNL
jgi:hypothetical protein